MKTVAMVLFPDFLLLDMAGPMEVFSVANRFLEAESHYQLITLGTERGPLRASNGVCVHADLPIGDNDECYDLLLVPGGPGPITKNSRRCSPGYPGPYGGPNVSARSAPALSCWATPDCSTGTA